MPRAFPLRKLVVVFASLAVLLLLYLFFWPVPIEPLVWTPPEPPPLTGVYEPNTRLAAVERLGAGAGVGPEDVAVDSQGRVYGGFADGRILRFQADGTQPQVFATTGDRPLGLHFDAAGNLVVADAYKGLLSISPDASIAVLSVEQGGVPFRLTDDVDIAADGTIYFSDASSKFPLSEFMLDVLEHRPNGRLLAYDPEAGTTRLLLVSCTLPTESRSVRINPLSWWWRQPSIASSATGSPAPEPENRMSSLTTCPASQTASPPTAGIFSGWPYLGRAIRCSISCSHDPS